MSDFSVDPAELDTAGQTTGTFAAGIGGLQATAPDLSMYGELVGSAAETAEPANTQSINDLLAAFATFGGSLAARCALTASAYRTTEGQQLDRAGEVGARVRDGEATVARGTAV